MINLKTMFTNNFLEKDPLVVLQKEHWSKILSAVRAMTIEYCRKNNIKLIDPKKQVDK